MARKKTCGVIAIVMLLVLFACFAVYLRPLGDPDALWKIVHGNCVPSQTAGRGPGKCQFVDLGARFAILKDLRGSTHFLVLPTDRITGIESPLLLAIGVANYWQAAWLARTYVEGRAGRPLPRDWIGLSVNSAHQRSQNQLHIHVDCVQPELHSALAALPDLAAGWSSTPAILAGHAYFIARISSSDLKEFDPFKLLASRLSDPSTQMGSHALSVIGMRYGDGVQGFFVLDSEAGAHGATSEDVLDRNCSVGHDNLIIPGAGG